MPPLHAPSALTWIPDIASPGFPSRSLKCIFYSESVARMIFAKRNGSDTSLFKMTSHCRVPPLVPCSLTSPASPLPSFPPAFLLSLALPVSQLHELLFSGLDMTVFLALSVLPAPYALPTSQILLLWLQSSA